MHWKTKNGIYYLSPQWALTERRLLQGCIDFLLERGFEYWQVPSSVTTQTYARQGISDDNGPILGQRIGKSDLRLAGSAEQGILQMLSGQNITAPLRVCAHNTCFRDEPAYEGLKRVREFQKVEQYMCVAKDEQEEAFEELLNNALEYMKSWGITRYRVVDKTREDPGYHEKKLDIEVWTKTYGWMETHSCSRFGVHQATRYDIAGEYRYTLSNTGAATPRLLVPLMENQ
jgi:seryl-tRNA synthetase